MKPNKSTFTMTEVEVYMVNVQDHKCITLDSHLYPLDLRLKFKTWLVTQFCKTMTWHYVDRLKTCWENECLISVPQKLGKAGV